MTRATKIQMIPFKDGFPRRLQVARKWRGFSQSQLAKLAKIPASSISHFEAGTREPAFDSFRRICYALNVDSEYLIGRSDNLHISMHPERSRAWAELDSDDQETIDRIVEAFRSS